MTFVDHIKRCNAHDLANFVPLVVDDEIVGHIRREQLIHLTRFRDVFSISSDAVKLRVELSNYRERSASMDRVVRALFKNDVLTGWRGESYPVGGDLGWSPRVRNRTGGGTIFWRACVRRSCKRFCPRRQ